MPQGSALRLDDVTLRPGPSDTIDVYAEISGYSSYQNVNVTFYYMFEQDISEEYQRPLEKNMTYDVKSGVWHTTIEKKYDSSTVRYYLIITDSGTGENITTRPSQYSYTKPLDFQYGFCLVGAVAVFAAFEVIMHYGRIRERFPRKEDEKEDENEKEGSGK